MSTSKSCWKNFERAVAKLFGTRRTPLSGGSSAHTRSDTLHSEIFIECKVRGKGMKTIYRWFSEAETQAAQESKIPMLVFREKGVNDPIIMIKQRDLEYIVKTLVEAKNGS